MRSMTASSRSGRPRSGSRARNARLVSSGTILMPGSLFTTARFTTINDRRSAILTNATSSILPGSAAFEAERLSNNVTIAQPRSELIFPSPRTTSSGNVIATNWLGRPNFGGRPRLVDELALIARGNTSSYGLFCQRTRMKLELQELWPHPCSALETPRRAAISSRDFAIRRHSIDCLRQ